MTDNDALASASDATTGYVPDAIVVDLPYVELVTRYLGKLDPGVRVAAVAPPSETLRLALLSLEMSAYAEAHGAFPGNTGKAYLDTMLTEVRALLATDFGRWLPQIGKNRYMHDVVGFPQSKPLGYGEPHRATAGEWHISSVAGAGDGVLVGVLDTAIYPHPGLAGHYIAEDDPYLPPGTPVQKWAGHATFVTGLIVAQAPAAKVIVKATLNTDTGRSTAWDTAVAMAGFADRGHDGRCVDVLNLSLGCRTTDGVAPLVMRRAIEVLGPRMVIVAAAGNHGATTYLKVPTWPAALPGVIAVGAAAEGKLGTPAAFSPTLPWVTCLAPGDKVVSTYLYNPVHVLSDDEPPTVTFEGYARWSGTSFAAATVSGAIAAGTVPGQVTAQQSVRRLLTTEGPLVAAYEWRDDKQRA